MSNVVSLPTQDRQQCAGETKHGKRCSFNAKRGTLYCGLHTEKSSDLLTSDAKVSMAQQLKDAEQQIMDLVPAAMKALVDILKDEGTKAADRIKAAQMVLDRAVAQRISVETATTDVRDLDEEIAEALAEVAEELRTGTDG